MKYKSPEMEIVVFGQDVFTENNIGTISKVGGDGDGTEVQW